MKNLLLNFTKVTFTVAFSLFLFNSTYAQKGNGKVITQDREIGSFTAIEVGGAFDVYLRQGDKEEITVVTDENLLDLVTTNIKSGTLKIKLSNSIDDYTELKVYITVASLNRLEVSGASNVVGKNTITTKHLSLDLSGACDLELEINCSNLTVEASGASDAKISGKSANTQVEASGASTLIAVKLVSSNAIVDASGASTVKIAVSGNLEAESSGASTVLYKGNPQVRADVSGAGTIKKM